MRPTDEQLQVIGYSGDRLVVRAFAGSGKTSTLVGYGKEHRDLAMLYLAYNRAIKEEAKGKFPRHVDCKTSHQLAYAAYGKHYQHKLTGNMRLTEVAEALDSQNWMFVRDVNDTLMGYLASADPDIKREHVPRPAGAINPRRERHEEMVVEGTRELWRQMVDRDSTVSMIHDGYLKLYQLSNPDLASRYDVILFDEAQDANPVTSAIVLGQQGCRVILVGDEHQQIYRWRGAENALGRPELAGADQAYLTNSFRFGARVAELANALLSLKGEQHKIKGLNGAGAVTRHRGAALADHAKLHRTVIGAIYTALDYADAGNLIYWVGGRESYNLNDLVDLYHFSCGRRDLVRNKRRLAPFHDYDHFKHVAGESGDVEMARSVKLVERYGRRLPDRVNLLRQTSVDRECDAGITVSTAHRSKGLEWDSVELEEDFADIMDPQMNAGQRNDEINLLYVAATRARQVLIVNSVLEQVAQVQGVDIDTASQAQVQWAG